MSDPNDGNAEDISNKAAMTDDEKSEPHPTRRQFLGKLFAGTGKAMVAGAAVGATISPLITRARQNNLDKPPQPKHLQEREQTMDIISGGLSGCSVVGTLGLHSQINECELTRRDALKVAGSAAAGFVAGDVVGALAEEGTEFEKKHVLRPMLSTFGGFAAGTSILSSEIKRREESIKKTAEVFGDEPEEGRSR